MEWVSINMMAQLQPTPFSLKYYPETWLLVIWRIFINLRLNSWTQQIKSFLQRHAILNWHIRIVMLFKKTSCLLYIHGNNWFQSLVQNTFASIVPFLYACLPAQAGITIMSLLAIPAILFPESIRKWYNNVLRRNQTLIVSINHKEGCAWNDTSSFAIDLFWI